MNNTYKITSQNCLRDTMRTDSNYRKVSFMFDFLETREQEFITICTKLELPHSIHKIPASQRGFPYHNSHHLATVAINSYHMGMSEGLAEGKLRAAFLAGLYHDVSYVHHSLENLNIKNSMNSFADMSFQLNMESKLRDYGLRLITNTHSQLPKDYTKGHTDDWIVHDADLSIWFNAVQEEGLYLCDGIEKELGIPTNIHTTKEFLSKTGMATVTGKIWLEDFIKKSINTSNDARWISF